MATHFSLKPNLEFGIVPTHIGFAHGLAPDAQGRLPRNETGEIRSVAEVRKLLELSAVKFNTIQIPYFHGVNTTDIAEVIQSIRALGLDLHLILFVNGADPMNPADEDTVVSQLIPPLKLAIEHRISHVCSTSIEEWMSTTSPSLQGAALRNAVAQNVKVHLRAYREAGLEGSSVKNWHIEFLRPGEFQTFSNIDRAGEIVTAANAALGRAFFKVLVDASHCGDSGLSITENQQSIQSLAAAEELGVFHCSAKTTRGCLTTDDGWIAALLSTAARTGELRHVFVEIFDHSDPALQMLREFDPDHGIDTRDGRTYTQVAVDALENTARCLNNLATRGLLNN